MCVLCTEKSDQFNLAMMESDTNIVSDEKLLLETALDGVKDSLCEASALEDVQTLENVTSSALCRPISSEPCLLQNNIPSVELPESDAGSNNDQFVNNCTAGHSTDDLVTAADEGFNEDKALPSERGDDATGTDQSSGICSPNYMTPNSTEEPCHITIVEVQSTADNIDSEEISNSTAVKIDFEEISNGTAVKNDSEEISNGTAVKIDSEEICNGTAVKIDSEEISNGTAVKIDSEEICNVQCTDTVNKSPVSNKKLCDNPPHEVLSPSRHSNVFELPFLQNLEKPDSSFSSDDTKRSSVTSPVLERAAVASASVGGTEHLSERFATDISVHSLMSDERDIHSEGFNGIQDCQPISIMPVRSTVVEEDELNDTVRRSGVSFHKDLQDDAKLWCQAYVKLVDCANLLLLTIPSVITDAIMDGKSPKTPKAESLSPSKSISPSKHSKDLGAASLFERIAKSHGSDANTHAKDLGGASLFERIAKSHGSDASTNSKDLGAASLFERIANLHGSDVNSLGDDTDSHSDRGRKKRQRRSRKAPETKARKSQSKSPRRIVFSRSKTSRKRSRDADPDEVICKLDAWKKLHKSKAKANKQSSVNTSPSLAAHEITVKQETIDDSLFIPSEYQFTSASGDSGHAQIKTELVSDADMFTASGDQVSQLPFVEPKTEVKDFSFAVIKQEPADDYLYMGNCDTGNIDNDCITPLFPIDDVVSLASVQIQVSGACYSLKEILQDDYWQPSVVLKRFPIWILQNLQSSAEGLSVDGSPVKTPQSEEVVDSWGSSFVTQGYLQVAAESVPFNISGYYSEADSLTLKLDENAVPPLSKQVSLNNEDESSLKIDASPSEYVVQPLSKRLKSGSASKVRGPKSKRVKEQEKKENEEESKVLSESVCKLATEVSTEPENTEMPRRSGRPRKCSRIKLQMSEEWEEPLEKENAGKISEKEKSGEILTPGLTEKISEVPAVEKKHRHEHRDNTSKAECAEPVRKRGRPKKETTVSEKLVEMVPNVADSKRILKGKAGEKVLMVEKKFRPGEEKKSKPKLGFVIPKKKPPDPNAVLPGTAQPKANSSHVPPTTSTFLRIPKLSKALSAEDKERSVLAKLDTEVGKREALKWNSHSSWTGKTSTTLNGNVADHQGTGSQDKQPDEKWQRTVVERFRLQNLKGPETLPLGSQQQRQPKVPLLGMAPGINAVGCEWNRSSTTMNHDWINSCGPGVGQPQNCAPGSFPLQPSHRTDEQWPIPTVGYSIPVIQSERLMTNTAEVQSGKQNCQGERDQTYGSLTEPVERSEPVLRDVPYANDKPDEVFSGVYGIYDDIDDDDDDDDNEGTDRLQKGRPFEVLASSSAAVPHSFRLLEDLPMADNMDDSIRLFAEAVQEAIEQGDISPEKCDRLVNLYEKLCRDLIAEDVTENQQNADAAGIICDTLNQTMFKELRSSEDPRKNRALASSFSSASDLLRSFGNADKCSSRGNSADYTRQKMTDQMPCRGLNEDAMRHEKSELRGSRACKSNASGSYRHEHNANHASSSVSFDGRTNRSFAILQDDALWRDLLAQGQSPGMSEESLELLRRLLLEAAKRGVYDEQMVNMLNVVCQHIKLEDSKEQSLRKEFGSCSAFQRSVRNESVEIPFINEEQHFIEGKGMLKKFHKQDEARCATPCSPVLSSRLQSGSYEVHGMSDTESESSFKGMFSPNRVAEDKSAAAEKLEQIRRKQEAFATKVLDEIRLLEMLVAIQCELAVVTSSGVPPLTTSESSAEPAGKSAEPVQPTEPGNLADSSMLHTSPPDLSKAVELSAESSQPPVQAAASIHPLVEKALSESCDTPNLGSEPLMCHPSTSTAGDESQDSHSTQKSTKSTKEKDTVIDKKSCDPKAIEEKVISMARNALKPHYHNGAITSEEFKLIMKKAIAKICKSRSTDISQKRITKFMNAYVEKVIQSRK